MLNGEPSQEILVQRSLGSQPASRPRLVTWPLIFLISFSSASRKWFSRKSLRLRTQSSGRAGIKGPGSGPSAEPGEFPWRSGFQLSCLGSVSGRPEKGVAAALVLHLQSFGALLLLLGQLLDVAQPPGAPWSVEIQAGREVSAERPQTPVDQVVDGGLHLRGIIPTNPGVRGRWASTKS